MASRGSKKGAKRYRKIIRDSIQGLTKPAIQRLLLKAGVTHFSGLIYEESRAIIKVMLENLIRDVVTVTQYERSKTLSVDHVKVALASEGEAVAIPSGKYDTASLSVKTRNAKVKNLQKDAEDVIFPRLTFTRLVKEVGQDYHDSLRYSADGLDLIQIYIEAKFVDIVRAANIATAAAGRKTILPKDIQVAMTVLGLRL